MKINLIKDMKTEPGKEKPLSPEDENEPSASNLKKSFFSSLGHLLFKLLLIGLGSFLLVCTILQYSFPGKFLTPYIARELTHALKVPVNIKSIDFRLLDGLQISELDIGVQQPILKVNSIILNYDLLALLGGKLLVHQAIIDQPQLFLNQTSGQWNLVQMLERLQGKTTPESTVEKESLPITEIKLPQLPIEIEIRRAAIQNISINAQLEDGSVAGLYGLNLDSKVKALSKNLSAEFGVFMSPAFTGSIFNVFYESSKKNEIKLKTQVAVNLDFSLTGLSGGRLTGMFGVKHTQLHLEQEQIVPDLFAQTSIQVFSNPQLLNVNSLVLRAGTSNTISLKGHILDFLQSPKIKAQMNPMSLQIDEIAQWVRTVAPAVSAQGKIDIKGFEVEGSAPQFKPQDIKISPIEVSVKNLSVDYKPMQISIVNANADIRTSPLKIQNGLPENLSAKVDLKIDQGSGPHVSFNQLKHRLKFSADDTQLSHASVDWDFSVGKLKLDHPETGKIETDLNVNGEVEGSLASGDFKKVNVSYSAGSLVQGTTEGSVQDFGKKSFKINQSLQMDLKKILALVPARFLEGFKELTLAGNVDMRAQVEGKLDSKFMPQKTHLSADTNWSNTTVNIQEPTKARLENSSGNTKISIYYDPLYGAQVNSLHINTLWDKADALDNWETLAGKVHLEFGMGTYFNPSAPTLIPLQLKTKLNIGSLRGKNPKARADDIALTAEVKGNFGKDNFENASVGGQLSLQNAGGMDMAEVKTLQTKFQIDADDINLGQTSLNVEGNLASPAITLENFKTELVALTFKVVSRQNIKDGNFEIDSVQVQAPQLLTFNMKGKAQEWGKSFSTEGKLEEAQLAPLLALAPQNILESVGKPSLSGTLSAEFKANGNLPENFSMANSQLPISGIAQVKLQNVSAHLPEQSIKTTGLNLDASVRTDGKNANLSGMLAAGQLNLQKLMGDTAIDPAFNFEYQLNEMNVLEIRKHEFSVKSLGLMHSASGRVEGFLPFATQEVKPEPAELLKRLSLILDVDNRMEIEKALQNSGIQFVEKGNLSAEGALQSTLKLQLIAGRKIDLSGTAEFDKFKIALQPDLQAGAVNGKFIFDKVLFLDRSLSTGNDKKFFASQKGFFSQLRDFSNYKNIIRIDSLKFQDKEISNIGVDLFYKDNRLMVDKFLFDLLHGTVGGSFALENSPEGPVLKFSSEFTGLDLGALLKNRAELTGLTSEIDGRQSLKLVLGKNNESVGLDQIEAEIEITRIGAETLDRLLLSIDPEESKPAIVDIRSKLKLASPHRALITIKNGNLSVEAWLKNKLMGGIIKAPEIKRVPIASLQEFEQVATALEGLKSIQDLLKYLSAKGIEFDEEGKIQFY